jgi:protoheme IX farnesyltransferase
VIIFVWTPPHFWALAVRYRDDYAAADVPMLPAVADMHTVAVRIISYTVVLWGLTLLFAPVAGMGALYQVAALVLGGVFTWYAWRLLQEGSAQRAMRLFHWSTTYVSLLFGAMALDQLVR